MIAIEEACIDLDTLNTAGRYTKSEYYPIEWCRIVSSCLPAVVPSSGICEDARPGDWWCRCCEVRCFGEPLIGECKNS
jgi:hypothetical protein